MKILVLGSKGFIGSHCVNYFLLKGNEVIGCDVIESSEENYISFKSLEGNFTALFKKYSFDYCINAAGSAHVNYSFLHPEKDFELNVFLVISVLGVIKNSCPDCHFINFSSAAVYGNPFSLPIPENADTKPLSPYGYHKLLSEKVLFEYFNFFNLKTCSLRVFSAYGEGLKKQLFWDLYNKSLNQETINLYGTGNESRDFIYIHDLVVAVEIIMKKAKFTGEIYNIANGEEISIREAAACFLNELQWKGDLRFSGEIKIGDPINWKADIRKIQELGYQKTYNLEMGLKRYCKWLKEKE